MSVLFRGRRAVEERAVTSVPWSNGGPRVGDASLEDSLSLVPVYAAVRLIADAVSTLPLQAFRKTSDGRTPIPLPAVFEKPTNHGTRVDWLQQCLTSLLLRGNAYGLEVGIDAGLPRMIEWLNPEAVTWQGGRVFYNTVELDQAALIHIPAMLLPGSREGVSPLSACRATVMTGVETQRFTREWYANKAVPGVIAKNTERTVPSEVASATKERLRSTMRAGEPFVTGKDWDFTFMKLSADDAGFVSSTRLTATQVANIYGVPPELIGGDTGTSMTYSTTEQQQIQFITHTLRPWLVRLEAAFSALLPKPQYVKFNVDALIRVDTKTRYEVHQIARTIGLNNIDELRAIEDEQPLPDGQGQDYTPLVARPAQAEAQAAAARAVAERATPAPVPEIHSHVHLRQEASAITVEPAPPAVVNNHFEIPVPEPRELAPAAAPVVNVQNDIHMPAQAAPVVEVVNEVQPAPVEVKNEITVEPAGVTVLPTEPKTRRIERDRKGEITAVHEE